MEHDRAYLSRDQYQQDDGEETFPISQDMILNAWAENETKPSTADKGLQYSSQRYHEQEQVGRQSARGPRFPGAAEQNRQSSGVPISSSHSETTVHSSPQRLEKSEDKESERPQPSSSPSRKRQVVNAPNNVQNQQNNLLPSVDSSLELSSPNWGSLMDSLQKTIQEEFDLHSQENRRRHQQTVADLQDQYQNELSKWRDHALKLQDENESLQAEKQQWMRISERLATTRGLMKLKNELWYGRQGVLATFRNWAWLRNENKLEKKKFRIAENHYDKKLKRKLFSNWTRYTNSMARENLISEWEMKLQQATTRADHEASVRVSEMQQRVLETENARDKAVKMVQHLRGQLQTLLKRGLSAMSEEADELLHQWGVHSSSIEELKGLQPQQTSMMSKHESHFVESDDISTNDAIHGLYARSTMGQSNGSFDQHSYTRKTSDVPAADAAADNLRRINAVTTTSTSQGRLDYLVHPEKWDADTSLDSAGPEYVDQEHQLANLHISHGYRESSDEETSGSATKVVWKRMDEVSTPSGQPPSTVENEESVVLRNVEPSRRAVSHEGGPPRRKGRTEDSKKEGEKKSLNKKTGKQSVKTRADNGPAKPVMHPSGSMRSVRSGIRRHASKNNVQKTADEEPQPKRAPPRPHKGQEQFNPAQPPSQRVAVYKHTSSPYRSSQYSS